MTDATVIVESDGVAIDQDDEHGIQVCTDHANIDHVPGDTSKAVRVGLTRRKDVTRQCVASGDGHRVRSILVLRHHKIEIEHVAAGSGGMKGPHFEQILAGADELFQQRVEITAAVVVDGDTVLRSAVGESTALVEHEKGVKVRRDKCRPQGRGDGKIYDIKMDGHTQVEAAFVLTLWHEADDGEGGTSFGKAQEVLSRLTGGESPDMDQVGATDGQHKASQQ